MASNTMSLDEISQMSASSSSATMMSMHKAAEQYEEQVIYNIQPLLVAGFLKMQQDAVQQAKYTNRISRRLAIFQQLLTKIPGWNTMILEDEIKKIKIEDIETLVQGLVMIRTKIQSILSSPDMKILMKVPTIQYVVHKCYIEAARILYRNVDVMDMMVSPMKQVSNRRKLDAIVEAGIKKAIASFVPTVALLRKQSKQIESRLRQELQIEDDRSGPAVDERSYAKEKVEIQSIAMRDTGTQPVIREAPPMPVPEPEPVPTPMPVPEPEPVPTPVPDSEPMFQKDEPVLPRKIVESNDIQEESVTAANIQAEQSIMRPKHSMKIDQSVREPMNEVQMEAPIIIDNMDEFDMEKSMSISLEIPTQNVKEVDQKEMFE